MHGVLLVLAVVTIHSLSGERQAEERGVSAPWASEPELPSTTRRGDMAIPTQVTFHGFRKSDAVEAAVHRWVARLELVYDRILRVEVRLDQPHRSHRQGREFEVHIHIEIPGVDIMTRHARHEDVYVAIADAFRASRRQLLDHLDQRREFITIRPGVTAAKTA
jgi:ribosomal subunit interface protein